MTNEAYHDQETLSGAATEVYEAIATLEFTGHQVAEPDIAASTGLDEDTVRSTLNSLTQRGVVHRNQGKTGPTYEPADRGWSTSPEQAENPAR